MTKNIGVIVGSLRNGSYTGIVANKIIDLLPEGYEGKILDISDLKFYNEDLDTETVVDESYKKLRDELDKVDAVVFATPEYNRSIPAVIKNAVDVGSRPYGQSKYEGKPALVVGVSPGAYGAFGANHHLRQSLVFLDMPVVQQPEAYLANITEYIENGEVTNSKTIEILQSLVDRFVDLIERY